MKSTEYIVQIDDELKNIDYIFIGEIRKQSKLIRCKDCRHWDGKYHYCEIIDDSRDWDADDYCSVAERKEDEEVRL